MRYPVFVYGTLMKGERAQAYLLNQEFAGEAVLRDYGIYHLGSYPGIKPLAGGTVPGELYLVDRMTLQRMDQYEGEGSLYHRIAVDVESGTEVIRAFAYVYAHEITGKPLLAKGWRNRSEQ